MKMCECLEDARLRKLLDLHKNGWLFWNESIVTRELDILDDIEIYEEETVNLFICESPHHISVYWQALKEHVNGK